MSNLNEIMVDGMKNMNSTTVLLNKDEAASLLDWLECHFIDDIRNDEDVDNMAWLSNMISIYNKCKAVTK